MMSKSSYSQIRRAFRLALVPLLFSFAACGGARAQLLHSGPLSWVSSPDSLGLPDDPVPAGVLTFESRADSLEWVRARTAAERATGLRIVISRFDRKLWVIIGDDTLRTAPAGIGMGSTLSHGKRIWRFETPRGKRVVLGKEVNPVWTPPLWHYVEVAREHGLQLKTLERGQSVPLGGGTRIEVRGEEVGTVGPEGDFYPLSPDEEIVFGDTLYVPPIGTVNRRIPGILGQHMLDMGDGYLLHGTPEKESIGRAATHGCVRLRDDDVEWLYETIPVGTPVYIY